MRKAVSLEIRKKKLFSIEVNKIKLLRQTRQEEMEVVEKSDKKKKSRMGDDTDDSIHFEKMAKEVKQMKSLSKTDTADPLSRSMAGVISLYQGMLIYIFTFMRPSVYFTFTRD